LKLPATSPDDTCYLAQQFKNLRANDHLIRAPKLTLKTKQ